MKKKNNKSKGQFRGVLQEGRLKKLIVKPLARQIKRQGIQNLKLGRKLFEKLQAVDESIEIIARQIYRKSRKER